MSGARFLRVVLLGILLAAAFLSTGARASSQSDLVFLSGFPTFKQKRPLTCESSVASMGTRGVVSEGRIMAAMPRNANPNLGFRGNPSGAEGLVNYGVYAAPVSRALTRFGYHSEVMTYANDYTIKQYVRRGWPVEVWVTYQLKPEIPRLASHNGVQFILVPMEHALLVVGFDNHTVIANDPWTKARVRYRWRDFNRSWGYFGNMALAIEPCALPLPISGLRMSSVNDGSLVFGWQPGKNASQYAVAVTLHGKQDAVVYRGNQVGRQVSIANPKRGATYEIDVQSLSVCGGQSTVQRLVVVLPKKLKGGTTPTPTPETPTPEKTVAITPTATSTATPIPTATLP